MATLHYLAGRGRNETTRRMLAASDIRFKNLPIHTPQALAVLRASDRLPFDRLALLQIDRLRISQTTALLAAMLKALVGTPGIAAYLESPQRWQH